MSATDEGRVRPVMRAQENPFLLEPILARATVEDRGYTTPCWISDRSRDKHGYTCLRRRGKTWKTHRYALHLLGVLCDGLVADHLCRQPACTRPSHLEQVEQVVNIMRGESFMAANAFKTHCLRGHAYTPENTYLTGGLPNFRSCLTCRKNRDLNRPPRVKNKKAA